MVAGLVALLPLLGTALAVNTQMFKAPADCPTCVSSSYAGASNGSLPLQPIVPGHGTYAVSGVVWLTLQRTTVS
jgi:hypothetical protein